MSENDWSWMFNGTVQLSLKEVRDSWWAVMVDVGGCCRWSFEVEEWSKAWKASPKEAKLGLDALWQFSHFLDNQPSFILPCPSQLFTQPQIAQSSISRKCYTTANLLSKSTLATSAGSELVHHTIFNLSIHGDESFWITASLVTTSHIPMSCQNSLE